MIKLPKEVNKAMKALKEAGCQVYVTGDCMREFTYGATPIDWDLSTDGKIEKLKELFPEAQIIDEDLGMIRFDYTKDQGEDGIILDISTFRGKDGITDDINKDLERRDFTINALADNPSEAFLDPYGGRQDIKDKLIKMVGDPSIRFKEEPILMMRAVRFAAELNYDLNKELYQAILDNAELLIETDPNFIRGEFEKIIVSENAGKGLRMLAGAELMPAIIGDVAQNMTRRHMELFSILADKIDTTYPVLTRRLGLFYLCFEKKSFSAIERLNYDEETNQHLKDALTLINKIYFIVNNIELKQFLAKYGYDRYDYIHMLSKAQKNIYGNGESKILSREHILKEIKTKGEPIFIEDLAINGEDLLEEGIVQADRVGEILLMLTDLVHVKSTLNTRKDLLKYAKIYAKSKFRASFRKVKWLK
ncbi:MAG: hypothetical protein RSD88_06165 [Anaerovoracaceae bacterium]